jgi:cbb3-type cytochrome oxidase maturation protein
MEIIYLLLPLSLLMAIIAVVAFVWGVRKEQFDDVDSAAVRMLFDEAQNSKSEITHNQLTSNDDTSTPKC